MSQSYVVFIPKYAFSIENGVACKKPADDSLSISVEADSKQDAIFKVLRDIGLDRLNSSGYSVDSITTTEDYAGSGFTVQIHGVREKHGR